MKALAYVALAKLWRVNQVYCPSCGTRLHQPGVVICSVGGFGGTRWHTECPPKKKRQSVEIEGEKK